MEKLKYQSQLLSMAEKRNVWRYLSIAMVASNIFLAFHLFGLEVKEKTIVVPADLTKEFWVHGDSVSPSYLEEMANMFSNWLKNFHPDNVNSQFDKVLQYSDPRVHSEMKEWLTSEAERVKKMNITSSFYPLSIRIDGEVVDVTARTVSMIGQRVVSDEVQTLRLVLRYHGGRLIIGSFDEGVVKKDGEFVSNKNANALAAFVNNKN